MPIVNPEPAQKKFKISPVQRVSAIFATIERLPDVLQTLGLAGFDDAEIQVFMGADGAAKIDPTSEALNPIIRFLHNLELVIADETQIHKKFTETLKNGGMAIDVYTRGDEDKKLRAARAMKEHGALESHYWGRWSIERL
jgi:hypothetical protein